MKPFTPIILLLAFSFSTYAQTEKVQVFCQLGETGKINYGYLPSLLTLIMTDSAKQQLLIEPRKQYHLTNIVDILTLMSLNGWKLVTSQESVGGSAGAVVSSTYYLLTKDIYLDEKGKALFVQRLMSVGN